MSNEINNTLSIQGSNTEIARFIETHTEYDENGHYAEIFTFNGSVPMIEGNTVECDSWAWENWGTTTIYDVEMWDIKDEYASIMFNTENMSPLEWLDTASRIFTELDFNLYSTNHDEEVVEFISAHEGIFSEVELDYDDEYSTDGEEGL